MAIVWKKQRGVRWIDGDCPVFDVENSLYNVIHAKTALIAKVNYRYYGMFISADHEHAEEKFIASFRRMKPAMIEDGLLRRDHPNLLSIQLTHSPCGKRDKRHGNCGADLVDFFQNHYKTHISDVMRIKVFDIYGGVRIQPKETRKGMSKVGSVVVNEDGNSQTLNVLLDTNHLAALTALRTAGIHVRAWNVKEKLEENQYLGKEFEVLSKRMQLRKPFRIVSKYGYGESGAMRKSSGEEADSAASSKWHIRELPISYDATRQALILAGFSAKTKWSEIPGAFLANPGVHIPHDVAREEYPESDPEDDPVMEEGK